jgi:hypothetical protein
MPAKQGYPMEIPQETTTPAGKMQTADNRSASTAKGTYRTDFDINKMASGGDNSGEMEVAGAGEYKGRYKKAKK